MYLHEPLSGLPRPNSSGGLSFMRRARPTVPLRPTHPIKGPIRRPGTPRRIAAKISRNAGAYHPYLRPMQVGDLGKMTPEQAAQKKEIKHFLKAQRKAVKQSIEGKRARKAAFQQAGVTQKDIRQTMKALKQSYKLGVPVSAAPPPQPSGPAAPSPTAPASPGAPGIPGWGMPIIIDTGVSPMSTGGGGGAGFAPVDPFTGLPAAPAEPAKTGTGLIPLALGAAALYFMA